MAVAVKIMLVNSVKFSRMHHKNQCALTRDLVTEVSHDEAMINAHILIVLKAEYQLFKCMTL